MLRHIEELRKKPKAVRNQYAFTIALSVTLLIAFIWTLSLPSRLTFDQTVAEEIEQPSGPSFVEQLSEIRTFVGEGIDEVRTQAELIESQNQQATATTVPFDTAHRDFFDPASAEITNP